MDKIISYEQALELVKNAPMIIETADGILLEEDCKNQKEKDNE